MPEITLPDMSYKWAEGGDVLKPSDSKIQQGWQVEIPPRQWFNWLDNRQDQAIAHIAQHGISVWSPDLEYQAGKSYVQGSDGIVYKALVTNTNVDPVGAPAGSWESAFLTAAQATQVATATQTRAFTANNVYLSPLQLANAFTGTRQSLTVNVGYQRLPGGLVIQWASNTGLVNSPVGSSTDVSVTYPIPLTTVLSVQLTHSLGDPAESAEMAYSIHSQSNTGASARFRRVAGSQTGAETVRANFLIFGVE